MSESEDSKKVDNSVSLPENRSTTLLHPKYTSDEMKSLQARGRDQKKEGGKVNSDMTDFEAETEDEFSFKKLNREDSELGDLKKTMSESYQNETEDESSTLEKKIIRIQVLIK